MSTKMSSFHMEVEAVLNRPRVTSADIKQLADRFNELKQGEQYRLWQVLLNTELPLLRHLPLLLELSKKLEWKQLSSMKTIQARYGDMPLLGKDGHVQATQALTALKEQRPHIPPI